MRRWLAASCILLLACTSEPAERVVVLPPEADRYERFINRATHLSADRITVHTLTAYRKDMGLAVDPDLHTQAISDTRITLKNEAPAALNNPVRVSFRNLFLAGREQIEIVFSDAPLLEGEKEPRIVRIVAEGVAHLDGDGVELIGDRIVVENDDAKAFTAEGRPLPGKP
jgi:hypothetical protein